ncbi:MAG: 1-acyl-sn-glycerol-3-phosphate acyltransferase [Gemmatimonadaceae bacterium]|nr:1-acyl-sn-glycerol-3-phosphate acyltransferase [Gemmatimonadaceae bacterium]
MTTPIFGGLAVLGALLGRPDVHGSVFDWAPRLWARSILWAAGVRLHLHNPERVAPRSARMYVANHVSWFDVFALLSIVPRNKWVAKAELLKIPIFGPAARRVGTIFIERQNRKAAFAQYDAAAAIIRSGASVIVAAEGTRADTYALRAFKKGPFVLAIAAGVPIVPTVVHGTLAVHPRGSWRVTSGDVHVHFLEEILTEGYSYDRRNELAKLVWDRMAEALRTLYGIESAPETERDPAGIAD